MVPIRIRYFKQNDYAYGMGLEKVEQLTIPKLDEMDINDAIEFYVINKYFDEGVRLKKWNDEQLLATGENSHYGTGGNRQ